VYYDDTIPDRLHFRNNRRIGRIIGVADLGWTITLHRNPLNLVGVSSHVATCSLHLRSVSFALASRSISLYARLQVSTDSTM
jgi:hypothetical protein